MNIILVLLAKFYIKYFCDITNAIKGIYYILVKMDCDLRTDVYLGVTSLLTAIVIFVAELGASSEKSKIDRKVFIRKTNILRNVTFMIINIIGLLLSKTIIGVAYYVFQIILNVSIFISIFQTLKMFETLIDLTLSENELAIERDKYIKEKLENYDIKIKKLKETEELSEKEIEKHLKNNNLILYEKYPYGLENYKAVEAKKEGILVEIDMIKAEDIANKIIKSSIAKNILKVKLTKDESIEINVEQGNEKVQKTKEQVIFIITALKGQYIYSKTPLFYIKKEYIKYIDDIFMCFKIIKDDRHTNEDTSIIIDEIINKVRNVKYYNTIHSDIVNFFEDIINNNWEYVEELFYSKIYKLAEEFVRIRDYEKIYVLYKGIEDISLILIEKYKIKEFEKYYNILFLLMLNIFDKPNVEIEDYSFEFIIFVNSCIYRCENYENQNEFLDLLLSKVLSLIKRLLRLKNTEAIYIILSNLAITIEHSVYTKKDDKRDVLVQFVLGIIYATMYEEKTLREIQFCDLKKIIQLLTYKFQFDYQYTTFEILTKLKKLSERATKIFGVFDNFAFGEPEDHRNMSSWSGNSLDINDAIIGFLNLYSVNKNTTVNEEKVDKYDQYFCDNFWVCLNRNKYKDFFEYFQTNVKIDIPLINTVLEEIKNISRKKEQLYKIQTPLNYDKIQEFKNIIFEGINNNSKLLKLFTKEKVKYSDETSVKNINIRNYLNREMFFSDTNWGKMYAEEVVETMNTLILDKILRKITLNPINVSSVEDAIDKIENKEEIIIISGVKDSLIRFKDIEFYQYNGIKIPIIKDISEKTLILERKALPTLKYMNYNKEKMLEGELRGNTYLVLLDLANNTYIQNKIIEECEEDDVDEIKEYLQTRCVFQIFIPLEILECTNEEVYIINE